jgi:hypothetical protein
MVKSADEGAKSRKTARLLHFFLKKQVKFLDGKGFHAYNLRDVFSAYMTAGPDL